MAGTHDRMYWHTNKNWYKYNAKTDDFSLTKNASERAKRSFDLWKGQRSDWSISTDKIIYFSMANNSR